MYYYTGCVSDKSSYDESYCGLVVLQTNDKFNFLGTKNIIYNPEKYITNKILLKYTDLQELEL